MGILILSCLNSFLYRLGGGWSKWHNNKLFRRIGCAVVTILGYILLLPLHYEWKAIVALFVAFGAMYGALCTYWKGSALKCMWYHWLLTGIGYGLASLPLIFAGIPGVWIWIRVVVLGILTMIISEKSDNVWVEEFGRGSLIILTLPILCL